MVMIDSAPAVPGQRKPVNFANIGVGAVMNLFEVTTLGQPFEVVKTQMASQRGDSMGTALSKVWGRGGPLGFYQVRSLPRLSTRPNCAGSHPLGLD